MPFLIEQDGKRVLNDSSLYIEPDGPLPDVIQLGHLAAWCEMLDQVNSGEADMLCIIVTDEAGANELEAFLRSDANPHSSRFIAALSTAMLKVEGMPKRRQRSWSVD